MTLFFIAFIAGVLTVLAPCVLPLLPVVIGGSVGDGRNRWAPLIITASLGVSIIVFTLVLKVSTAFISIPQSVWNGIAGGILIVYGTVLMVPQLWETLMARFRFDQGPQKLLARGFQQKSIAGNVVIGAALGPVFSACSPTYAVILATVLPQRVALGLVDLSAYVFGLSMMLLLIGFLGQRFVSRLGFASDPQGWFKRGLGALFLLVGLLIFFGADKTIEAKLLDVGIFDVTKIESQLLEKNK